MNSPELMSTIMSSMTDLQLAAQKPDGQGELVNFQNLDAIKRNAKCNLKEGFLYFHKYCTTCTRDRFVVIKN